MNNESLSTQWFQYFKRKLKDDFKINPEELTDYQLDATPLIYCCLLHRRVPVKSWNIAMSKEFQKSEWIDNPDWIKIKEKLESGEDINPYMSKSIKKWDSTDSLLYTFRIHHFHLFKNKDGGIRDELVYGVFHDNTLYVLNIEKHHDLYEAEKWITIILNNWPNANLIPNLIEIDKITEQFDSKTFKRKANDPNLCYNLLQPLQFKDKDKDKKIRALQNQQHTTTTGFTLNNIHYSEIPFQAYCAYRNEMDEIKAIESSLVKKYGNQNFHLNIDIKNKKYIIRINYSILPIEKIGIKEKLVTCSLYHTLNYYPYIS